jgi:probable O-glycosylation ligase (exosortase A-associated)
MPIRDLALTVTILLMLPIFLFRPWVGLLAWAWIGYMNPHRLTWSFAFNLPFAMLVAIPTMLGFLFTRERRPFLWTRETVLLLILWGWFTVTSIFSVYPDAAWAKWNEVSKILLMAMLTVPLFQDRERLRLLLLVIACSLGFYGLKGGIFALMTGGQYMVLGPPNSFFADNTELSLALTMSAPISLYLAKEETDRRRRLALYALFFFTVVAVPFTYSRAGILGLAVVLIVLFASARRRVLMIPIVVVGLFAFVWFAPERWFNRVETLQDYQADQSAQLRLMSWRVGVAIASERPVLGGGFRVFIHRETYDMYLPEFPLSYGADAHSVYFGLLGEHGWVGLGLYLALVGCTLSSLQKLRRLRIAELAWISQYARMLQASLLAFLVTGAFLSVAYFDLVYQLIMVAVILKGLARQHVAAAEAAAGLVPVPTGGAAVKPAAS